MKTVQDVKLAFEASAVSLPLQKIVPLKQLEPAISQSQKYKCIAASIAELGVIEPLVVFPQGKKGEKYLLLDGHVRFDILKKRGELSTTCLIATEEETFTYNHKINRVAPIQEHFMILKALNHGVSEERLATTLNVDVKRIRQKRDLLNGVCQEAVALLKDCNASPGTFREIKNVVPMRQIEMAELMIASNNFSTSFAKCLFAATPQEQLVDPGQAKSVAGLRAEDLARMESEMGKLSRDLKLLEDSYGRNNLNLIIASRYLQNLLKNKAVVRFLDTNFSDFLVEFRGIVEAMKAPSPK